MLYALDHPLSLLVLVVSFVVSITLQGWVQSAVAQRMGDARPRLEHRLEPDPRRHLDPFGAIAAALSGLGWNRPVELLDRRRRGAVWAVGLSGAVVSIALGAALLVAYRLAYPNGTGAFVGLIGAATFLQHGLDLSGHALEGSLLLLGCSQLYLGVMSLVPLPPLAGGKVLFALAPRTPGWQKAEHYLVEQNVGIGVLLAILIIPLGGDLLLPHLLDVILKPVLRLLLGG